VIGFATLDRSTDGRRSSGRRKPSTKKEANVEETIGYEALFCAEEWDAIRSGDWSEVPSDDWGSSKEGESKAKHSVFVASPPGQYEGNEERFELECDVCDYIGAVDTMEEAQAIARLNEAFVATLAGAWIDEEISPQTSAIL
jgi:hypothetical protein